MFYASKGPIQLQVKLNDELTIIPMASSAKFENTAKIIAISHKAIINHELRDVPIHEKAESIKHYFTRNGWEIHT